jgi:hypothetical protein
MIHRYLGACALWIGAACFAVPAAAGGGNPLAGTWEMKISCKGTATGVPTTRKQTIVLPIVDGLPGDLQAGSGSTGAMIGYVLYETAKPERARIALVGCGVSALNGLLIQASGKVTPEKASLKGTAVFLSVSTESTEQCTAKLVRTSTKAPIVPTCS